MGAYGTEAARAAVTSAPISSWSSSCSARTTPRSHVPVATQSGNVDVPVNQQANGGTWNLLGTWNFNAGSNNVKLIDQANGFVAADAVKVVPANALPATATWTFNAVTAGAQWRVDGGDWQNGGATIPIAPGANRLVEFKPVAGWAAPASQPVSVVNGQTRVVNGSYNPPPGVPLITTVSPGVGPLAGGTLLNIVGANFAAPATVSIGGQSASTSQS